MLPRFYVPIITSVDDTITLHNQAIIHQIINVLRLKKNDVFSIFSSQQEYQVRLKTSSPTAITLTILKQRQTDRKPAKRLILYQALLKKDNFEWILQKGTELGISSFVPIITEHTIIRKISDNKRKRYQKIITEATEQCGGRRLPELRRTLSFNQAISAAGRTLGQKIIAWEGQTGARLLEKFDNCASSYHFFIGPEGGFSSEEIDQAQQNNITVVSLGERILRAETAAIAAASFILLS